MFVAAVTWRVALGVVAQDFGIVGVDKAFYVSHAGITHFHVIFVENFMQRVVLRKAAFHQVYEFPSYVCGHCLAEGRVVPCTISASVLFLFGRCRLVR